MAERTSPPMENQALPANLRALRHGLPSSKVCRAIRFPKPAIRHRALVDVTGALAGRPDEEDLRVQRTTMAPRHRVCHVIGPWICNIEVPPASRIVPPAAPPAALVRFESLDHSGVVNPHSRRNHAAIRMQVATRNVCHLALRLRCGSCPALQQMWRLGRPVPMYQQKDQDAGGNHQDTTDPNQFSWHNSSPALGWACDASRLCEAGLPVARASLALGLDSRAASNPRGRIPDKQIANTTSVSTICPKPAGVNPVSPPGRLTVLEAKDRLPNARCLEVVGIGILFRAATFRECPVRNAANRQMMKIDVAQALHRPRRHSLVGASELN